MEKRRADAPAARPRRGAGGLSALWARALRLPILASENFLADQAHLRAAALTYTALLSLVPALAFAFALLRGLGFEENVLDFVLLQFFPATEAGIYERILGYIARVNAGTVGAIGVAGLLLTVVLTLNTVERSLNVIFRARRPRTLVRKLTDYFSILFLAPLLLGVTISATAFLQLREWLGPLGAHWLFTGGAALGLKLLPLIGAVVLFALVLLVMPNARVRPRAAAVGGITGGLMWFVLQWAYVRFQFGFSRNEAIYGALAQLPILMVWIYLAWCVLLYAAELAALLQGRPAGPRGGGSPADPRDLALRLMAALARRSATREPPWTLEALQEGLDAPREILETVADQLKAHGLLAEANEDGRLLLGRHPAAIPAAEIFDAVEEAPSPEGGRGLEALLADMRARKRAALEGVTLEHLRTAGGGQEGSEEPAPLPREPSAARMRPRRGG